MYTTGIFAMLDDECKLPGASDEKYVCIFNDYYTIILFVNIIVYTTCSFILHAYIHTYIHIYYD